jgi:hypothetical protein
MRSRGCPPRTRAPPRCSAQTSAWRHQGRFHHERRSATTHTSPASNQLAPPRRQAPGRAPGARTRRRRSRRPPPRADGTPRARAGRGAKPAAQAQGKRRSTTGPSSPAASPLARISSLARSAPCAPEVWGCGRSPRSTGTRCRAQIDSSAGRSPRPRTANVGPRSPGGSAARPTLYTPQRARTAWWAGPARGSRRRSATQVSNASRAHLFQDD